MWKTIFVFCFCATPAWSQWEIIELDYNPSPVLEGQVELVQIQYPASFSRPAGMVFWREGSAPCADPLQCLDSFQASYLGGATTLDYLASPELEGTTLSFFVMGWDGAATLAISAIGEIEFSSSEAETRDSIEQWGITWTLDRKYPAGQFANGDWWVVGPVTIESITPSFDGQHHGWEVNPSSLVNQGLDSRAPNFQPSLIPELPYAAQPGESIVKAVSASPGNSGCRPCLETAAVLTVLDSPPSLLGAQSFRPPYFGSEKPLYSAAQLGLDRLPSYPVIAGAMTPADALRRFERVQLDHKETFTGEQLMPTENTFGAYGASITTDAAEAVLTLLLDYPQEDKTSTAIALSQYGVDLFYMMKNGRRWSEGGGHGTGRKLPLVFTAYLLEDAEMIQALQQVPREMPNHVFAEDGLLHFNPLGNNGLGVVVWGDDARDLEYDYWNAIATGNDKSVRDPYVFIDGHYEPGSGYQFCCTSIPWKYVGLALNLLPELQPIWNYDHFLIYVNRWVHHGTWTQADPCAPFDGSMANYGITFGPDGQGGCILDTNPSDGLGRFPGLDGTNANQGHYGSFFGDDLWEAMN